MNAGLKFDHLSSRRNSIHSQSSSLSPTSITPSPTPPKARKNIFPRSDFIDATLNRKSESSDFTNPETEISLEPSLTDFGSNKNIMMKKNDSMRCDIRGLDGDKIIDNHMSATSMRTDREEYDLSTEHSPEYFMTHSGTLEGCERGSAFRTGNNINLHENENFNKNFDENLHENLNENKNINKESHFNINKNINNNIFNKNNNSNLNNNNHINNDINIKNESSRIDGSTINYSLGKFSPDYYGSQNPLKNINQNNNQNYNNYNQKESSKENHDENQNENKNESHSESEGSALCGPSSSLIR